MFIAEETQELLLTFVVFSGSVLLLLSHDQLETTGIIINKLINHECRIYSESEQFCISVFPKSLFFVFVTQN